MLGALIGSLTGLVVQKIGNYLIEETSKLMAVKGDLEDLKTELRLIRGYLKDVEAREREDEVSKEWTKLVLDIAYDIEDVLDIYFLKLHERSQKPDLGGLTNKIGEKIIDPNSIVDEVKSLKRRILDINRTRGTYSINEPRRENTTNLRVRQVRRAPPVDQEEQVVGLEDDANKLLVELLGDNEEEKRHIISIIGMGGLGKTALARMLYNSRDVKERFDCRAWAYVSQEYKPRDILIRIIRSLGVVYAEKMKNIRMCEESEELEDYLYGILEEKRYLVVVDDVWYPDVWKILKRALPCNHRGSRVIITTRNGDVAEGFTHKLRFLTFEESWRLFEQKAFMNIEKADGDLQRTAKEMVQKCRGLPLAVVVLSELLSKKRTNEWPELCASLWQHLKDKSNHVSTIVFDLSFKEMRPELKLCFLYLSVFPEDYEIDVEKLIHLFVAEGFIEEEKEMMKEDVARDYIEEMINRSLVQAVRIERGRVMSCRIHDLQRDEAIKKAKEHNFVNVYSDHAAQHSSTTCRREVVHRDHMRNYMFEKCQNKMRSLMFFRKQYWWRHSVEGDFETICLKLKLLRVFDLGGIQIACKRGKNITPDVIGDLVFLRYLGISHFCSSNPAFISNLRFLQTLDASDSGDIRETVDLRKLTSLRHVIGKFVGDLLIGDAVNLQTLRSISSYSWSKLKHESLINLRDLEIHENYHHLKAKYESQYLAIDVGYEDSTSIPVCLDSITELRNLRVLRLEGIHVIKLLLKSETTVRSMDVIFPSLESVTLVRIYLEKDTMRCLQKSPRLENLILEDCDYEGKNITISAQGFCRLRRLKLDMDRLYELQIGVKAMPSLIQLELRSKQIVTKLIIPKRVREFIRIIKPEDLHILR